MFPVMSGIFISSKGTVRGSRLPLFVKNTQNGFTGFPPLQVQTKVRDKDFKGKTPPPE